MYDEENKGHYDYFDYIDDKGLIQQYEPDSDMDFITFKQTIMEEWSKLSHSVKCQKVYV